MSQLRIVAYEPARRQELLDLWAQVWGSTMGPDEFEWWFERNPAGAPVISLADDGDRLVGVACMSPYRLLVEGGEVRPLVPLHVATHTDYRARGVFTRLEAKNELRAAEIAPIAITFPNERSRRIFISRFGWVDLPRPRVWACPTFGRRAPAGVVRVREFGPEADALWQRVAPQYGTSLIRDSVYLNWRFAAAPRAYTCLAGPDGIVVVGRRRLGRLSVAYVAELVAEKGAAVRRLLRAALAAAQAPALVALPPHGRSSDLVRVGFLPTPKRILVLGKQLQSGASLPTDWHFNLGDGDSF